MAAEVITAVVAVDMIILDVAPIWDKDLAILILARRN